MEKGGGTVGGTSLAAFRPGFFRGGRTHVLLNAPLEMISGQGAEGDSGEALEADKRGARGDTLFVMDFGGERRLAGTSATGF
jgi:hypothetical protein